MGVLIVVEGIVADPTPHLLGLIRAKNDLIQILQIFGLQWKQDSYNFLQQRNISMEQEMNVLKSRIRIITNLLATYFEPCSQFIELARWGCRDIANAQPWNFKL